MKILTFTSLFPNAVRPELGIFIQQRLAAVAGLTGDTVKVVAPVPFFPFWLRVARWQNYRDIPLQEQIEGITVFHPRYPFLPAICMPLHGLLMFLGSLSSVRCLHKEFGFDCIDAHYVYPDGFAAVLLGKVLDVPVFVSARGTDINVFPSFPMIRPMVRWALRHATGLIAVSGALRTSIAQLGIPEGNVRIIPNGVDTERFRPVAREEARRTLNLPEHAPVVVSVGSLNAAKRHSLLIQSLVEVAEKYPDLRAYIVGEGPLRSELLTLIEAAGMKDHVVLVGGKPNRELYLWFSAADVSCLASSREGWPNVIMESIACGTPVVATKVGGVPEILDSSELGVLVDGEESAIAAGICAALERTWNRQSLVRIAESRTWKAVAEEVVAYFRHQP